MNRIRCILLLMVVTAGCIKVEEPEQSLRHAVFCALSPEDSLLTATVSRVVSIGERYDSDSVEIVTATVTVSNGTLTKQLIYNAKQRRYETPNDGFVQSGQQYQLTAQVEQTTPLTGTCVVPSTAPEFQLKGELLGDDYAFIINWQDQPNERNYYKISTDIQGDAPPPYSPPTGGSATAVVGSSLQVNWGSGFAPYLFLTDETSDGQRIQPVDGFVRRAALSINPIYVSVSVSNMDKLYYEFDRASYKTTATDDGLLNRFKEPGEMPSNIENGLGIFTAYSRRTVRIRIK